MVSHLKSQSIQLLNRLINFRVEKYRPASLDELISHDDIVSTIKKFIDANQLPHLLFYGPAGTGE